MKDTADKPIEVLMLIDDSTFDQMIYRRIAEKSGLVNTLLQYTNPEEALEYLFDVQNPRPSLILLDINMPQMDGFEFLEAATEKVGIELCPVVVMLTTSLNPKDAQRAKRFELVRDFLNKPLTHDQLRALSHLVRDPIA